MLQRPKVVQTCDVFSILTSKCASRHNGMHFFNNSTSESAPSMMCLAFWLRNVLRATTACTFSTSNPIVFTVLSSKRASRHSGVQLFISHLARWLRTRCFSEPTFRPSGATKQWKSTASLFRGTCSRQRCTQLSIFEGSLAELLRFWCCQLRKLEKSRKISSFLTLPCSKIEGVSKNCLVFDVAHVENWGSLAE